jgi:riboflavin synthase
MFTGLIQAIGRVAAWTPAGRQADLAVDLGPLAGAVRPGDSVALSGVCCTVSRLRGTVADFRLSEETLGRTWLGSARPPRAINLEPAVRAGEPLGGHLVQGHVDGVAELVEPVHPAAGGELVVRLPPQLLAYCVEKGSIALDGVSLTIAAVAGDLLRIAVIPHTAQVTTLGAARRGDPLHVEVDVLAKYVERLLAARLGSR